MEQYEGEKKLFLGELSLKESELSIYMYITCIQSGAMDKDNIDEPTPPSLCKMLCLGV